jgi:hypothetical protein
MLRDLSGQSPGGMNMRLRILRRVKWTQNAPGRASHVFYDAKTSSIDNTFKSSMLNIANARRRRY